MKNVVRKVLASILAASMVFALTACGGDSTASTTAAPAATQAATQAAATQAAAQEAAPAADAHADYPLLTLKFNCIYTNTDASYKGWEEFFKGLEEATDGAVVTEMYAGESLGITSDTIEQAAHGEPVIANTDVAYLGNYVPDLSIGNAPYVFQEPEDIQAFWESPYCADMEKKLGEEYGLKIMTLGYFGTRNVICNKEVHSRDEFSKIKLRCAATPMWNEVVRVLGAQAVNTAWSEAYSACSQGVADGAESPYSLLYSSKLYECCPYVIETNHLIAVTNPTMSYELYNNLPDDVKEKFDAYCHSWCDRQIEITNTAADECKQLLADEGVTFIDVDKAPFIAAAAETPSKFTEWTPGLYEKIVEYLNEKREERHK